MRIGFQHLAWLALLLLALVGTIASTVFLGMVLAAARRFRRVLAQRRRSAPPLSSHPGVTMLKPIHGLEPRMEENLEGYFRLDYPDYEIVFGCRGPEDPSLAIVSKLSARFPDVKVRIVYSGPPAWPNAKVYSLDKMIATSTNDYFVITDSDITIKPDFLKIVVPYLLQSEVGLVTCLYRGVPVDDFWSRLEALGMSVELPSGVLVADMLEGMRFALGAVMAVKRSALEKIGGISSTADYYSDDFVLGNRVADAGFSVMLENPGVGHVLTSQTFANTFRTQLRWMQSTRYSRPKGHFGTGLTFSMPFGVLGAVAAAALHFYPAAIALLAWGYLNRVLQCYAVGWRVVGDPRAVRYALAYPIRDLLGFIIWAASYLGGDTFNWRGELYRFTPGGRIVAASRDLQTN
jgi:ceramide glucosyltransferase